MPTALKFGKWLATVLTVLLLTVYFSLALDARRMPPLGPEHRINFDEEFNASMEDETDWAAYLAIEDRLTETGAVSSVNWASFSNAQIPFDTHRPTRERAHGPTWGGQASPVPVGSATLKEQCEPAVLTCPSLRRST